MTIVADIICKNEEDYIEYCIRSIEPYVDMIFITDTGSTDDTTNIISRLRSASDKIKIYNMRWEYDYSKIHNFVMNEMRHYGKFDYYLRVDADEIYIHSVLSTLKEQLSKCPDQLAWNMPYINFHGGHGHLDRDPYKSKANICKFDGYDVKYIGNVHEYIHIDGRHIMSLSDKTLDGNFFHHYSWCYPRRSYKKKLERIRSEKNLDVYNGTSTQMDSIIQFYSQFKDEPRFQVKKNYHGIYPEVLEGSWMLEDKVYSIDNNMDDKCINTDEYCKYQCKVDSWETVCCNYNHRRDNCI